MFRQTWATVILLATLIPVLPCYGRGPSTPPCHPWAGVYPTVLTPFCCTGGIDTLALERQLRHELAGGVHGLLVLGTIGEGQSVNAEERAQVVATAVRVAGPCVPVVVGIHACDVDVARSQLLQAKELGAAAVLVKYLGNPKASPAEVLGFYAALSDLHALPIFYYHYPSQTRLRLAPEDIARIIRLPGVAGIKESTLDLSEVEAHIRLTCGQGKAYLTSTALNLTQFLDLGGHGAMCPEAVLLPCPTVRAYTAYLSGRHAEARSIQKELFVLVPILRSRPTPPCLARMIFMTAQDLQLPVPLRQDPSPARLKAALNCLGVPTPAIVKCPLEPLTKSELHRVQDAIYQVKAIDWLEAGLKPPPIPLKAGLGDDASGMLLKTGSIQLGPGVGKNVWGWQGDGYSGF